MTAIDTARLILRPISREVAVAILEGRELEGVVLAAGYPSPFSLEVMEAVARPSSDDSGLGPSFFIVRKADGAILGEIGYVRDDAAGTAQVGYTLVEPSWGQGYATEALRALVADLFAQQGVRRVLAETLVGHTASRRVMEKAGMRLYGQRTGEEAGETVELVIYEITPDVDSNVRSRTETP